jgi:hypothetical protein
MPEIAQRPAMGGRTTSAPVGELYKLDARKPGGSVNTLVEEEEGPPTADEARMSRQNEVCLDLIARTGDSISDSAFSTGLQGRISRSDYCRGGRRERWQEQLRQMCIGYEERTCRSFK